MIQAGITRSVPAEDPATSQAELARLRAEYEAELGVWRGKYQQAEVDRENSSSFEKVELLNITSTFVWFFACPPFHKLYTDRNKNINYLAAARGAGQREAAAGPRHRAAAEREERRGRGEDAAGGARAGAPLPGQVRTEDQSEHPQLVT